MEWRFFRYGVWRLFTSFFSFIASRSPLTTCPSSPFSPFPRPIRPSKYLPARARIVLADCSLTSGSKYNILPFVHLRRRHFIRSSCVSSCARHPYTDGMPRVPTLGQGNELVKRQSRATRAVRFSDFLVRFSPAASLFACLDSPPTPRQYRRTSLFRMFLLFVVVSTPDAFSRPFSPFERQRSVQAEG